MLASAQPLAHYVQCLFQGLSLPYCSWRSSWVDRLSSNYHCPESGLTRVSSQRVFLEWINKSRKKKLNSLGRFQGSLSSGYPDNIFCRSLVDAHLFKRTKRKFLNYTVFGYRTARGRQWSFSSASCLSGLYHRHSVPLPFYFISCELFAKFQAACRKFRKTQQQEEKLVSFSSPAHFWNVTHQIGL